MFIYRMSKTALKKLLREMSYEQVCDLLLEVYDARPQAKDFLDFYVNPDLEPRLEKARVRILKELTRRRRGTINARITHIRGQIREIASLHPGAEPVIELMGFALRAFVDASNISPMLPNLQKGVARLLSDMLRLAADTGLLEDTVRQTIETLDRLTPPRWGYSRQLPGVLKEAFDETMHSLTLQPLGH